MSCTWTIFEGGEVVKGRKKTTVKEFVRMDGEKEEGGNGKFNYRRSKRRKGKYGLK